MSKCDKLAKSSTFGSIIILAIVAIAVLEIAPSVWATDARALASHVILGIFTLEIVVKVVAEGVQAGSISQTTGWVERFHLVKKAGSYAESPPFPHPHHHRPLPPFLCAAESVRLLRRGPLSYVGFMIDLGSITVLRLLRLLRAVRMLNKFPAPSRSRPRYSTRVLGGGLRDAHDLYRGLRLRGDRDDHVPQERPGPLWAHVDPALMSVWCMETLDWTNILNINMLGCDEVRAITRVSISLLPAGDSARARPVRLFRHLR